MFNHSTVGTHWKFCKYVDLCFPSRFPTARAWSGWSRLFPESWGGRAALSCSQLALATRTVCASVWAVASFSFCSEPLLLFLEWFEPHGFSFPAAWHQTAVLDDQPLFPGVLCLLGSLVLFGGFVLSQRMLEKVMVPPASARFIPKCLQCEAQCCWVPLCSRKEPVSSSADNRLLTPSCCGSAERFPSHEVAIWHFSFVSPSWHDMKGVVAEDTLLTSCVI